MSNNLALQISGQILSTKGILPSQKWLGEFLTGQKPNLPLQSLSQTALFRLLAQEITISVQAVPENTFPPNIHDVNIRSTILKGPIPVQIIDVEDIGHSKMAQLEAIEASERGEKMKGKEVIRVIPGEEDTDPDNLGLTGVGGPHKLLLEDANGVRVYAMEFKTINGISAAMNIGGKMVLRDVKVLRSMLMLEPGNTTLVGGKVEALHKAWRDERKGKLRAALDALKSESSD